MQNLSSTSASTIAGMMSSSSPLTSIYGSSMSTSSDTLNNTSNSNNNSSINNSNIAAPSTDNTNTDITNEGNLSTKASAHSASHSALAAAAALQSLNQSHIQRAHQTQPSYHPSSSMRPPSSSSSLNLPTNLPQLQQMHGNNSMPKLGVTSTTSSDHQNHNHLALSANQQQDNNPDFNVRFQQQPPGIRQPSWQEQAAVAAAAAASMNGAQPRWLYPNSFQNTNHLGQQQLLSTNSMFPPNFPSNSVNTMSNSNIMIGQDGDSQGNNNPTSRANSRGPSISDRQQFISASSGPLNLDGKNSLGPMKQQQSFPWLEGFKNQTVPQLDASKSLMQQQQQQHHQQQQQRAHDEIERLQMFTFNLYNTYIPGTNKPKKVISMDSSEGLKQSILNGEFYTRYENIAFDILQNQVIIPEFNIIDYIRREKSSLHEIERIESVHKRLGISPLLSLLELSQQPRPPTLSNTSLLMKTSDSRLPLMENAGNIDMRSAEQSILDQQIQNVLRNSAYYRELAGGAGPQLSATSSFMINERNRRSSQSPSDNMSSRSHNGNNNCGSSIPRNLPGNLIASQNQTNPTSYQPVGLTPVNAQSSAPQIYQNQRNQPLHSKPQPPLTSFYNPNINPSRPPPRSQSTVGPGTSCRSPHSPYSACPPRCPPQAHQNSMKSTVDLDLAQDRHNLSFKGPPLSAHQSSRTPQLPKLPINESRPHSPRLMANQHSPPGLRNLSDDKIGRMLSTSMTTNQQVSNLPSSRSEIDPATGLPLSAILNIRQQQELSIRNTGNLNFSSNQTIGNHLINSDHNRPRDSRPSSNPQMPPLYSPHNQLTVSNNGPPLGSRGFNSNTNVTNSSMPPPTLDSHKNMNIMDLNSLNMPKSMISPSTSASDCPSEAQLKQYSALMNAYQQQQQHAHQLQLQHQQNLLIANQTGIPSTIHNPPPMMNSPCGPHTLQINTAPPVSDGVPSDINRLGSLSGDKVGLTNQQPSPKQSNQRSIITGSASGVLKKAKKGKPSPPISQLAVDKLSTSPTGIDENKLPAGIVDCLRSTSQIRESGDGSGKQSIPASTEVITSDVSCSDSAALKENHRGIVAEGTKGVGSSVEIAAGAVAQSNPVVPALNQIAQELSNSNGIVQQNNNADIDAHELKFSKALSESNPIIDTKALGTFSDATAKNQDNYIISKAAAGQDKSSTSGNNCTNSTASATTTEPQSKYQKLYTKKAWLKNYGLEDQLRSQSDETPDNIPSINKSEIKSEILDSTTTSSSKPSSPKINNSSKSNTNLKRKKKSKEAQNKPKSSTSTKQNPPSKSADNDSGAQSSSTSELDTDEDDAMGVKKLRRMPRRKVKPTPVNNSSNSNNSSKNNQQQSSPKTKAVARENSRKKIKREPASEESQVKEEDLAEKDESNKRNELQLEPCYEIVPKNIRCLECRRIRVPNTKGDKVLASKQSGKNKSLDDFCRFYAFRKLSMNKNAQPIVAGFSDLNDVTDDDKRPWLPQKNSRPVNMNFKVAKYILTNIGDQFCSMTMQEREAQALYQSQNERDKKITWKRAVNGLRELCDVCATTLFNCHYVCEKCGFVVCIECYQSRARNYALCHASKVETQDPKEEKDLEKSTVASMDSNENGLKDAVEQSSLVSKGSKRDALGWIYCAKNEKHCHRKLTLSQIITSDCIEEVWTMLHEVRDRLKLGSCVCSEFKSEVKVKIGNKLSELASTHADGTHSTLKGLLLSSSPNGTENIDDSSNHSTETDCNLQIHEDEDIKSNLSKDDQMFSDSSNHGDDSPSEDMELLKEQVTKTIDDCIAAIPTESINTNPTTFEDETNLDEQAKNSMDKALKTEVNMDSSTHSWLCDNELLVLSHAQQDNNIRLFRKQWVQGKPLVVRGVDRLMDIDMWLPQYFGKQFGDYRSDLVDCRNGDIHRHSMKKYWDGFEPTSATIKRKTKEDPFQTQTANNDESSNGPSYYSGSALWRLKDWPPGQDFFDILPEHYDDFMNNLPLKPYTTRTGFLNLAYRLPEDMLKPDLGPKMYSAYGTSKFPDRGTTNLHLDISDAINVMIYVNGASSFNKGSDDSRESYEKTVMDCCIDQKMKDEIISKRLVPGALWHIFKPCDAPKMRKFLNKVSEERNISPDKRTDPIHDQTWYLDQNLLDRMFEEQGVRSYPILQCMGDAVVIPAGAPHQVKNLQNCIKVANDFVSPENVEFCLQLTNEFRSLPETHMNQEDKLQIKNIIYHSVKQCLQYIQLFESGELDGDEKFEGEDELDID